MVQYIINSLQIPSLVYLETILCDIFLKKLSVYFDVSFTL